MRRVRLVLVLAVSGALPVPAYASHGFAHYPSYYPHEIRMEWLAPSAAAEGLADNTLHVYLGPLPGEAGGLPKDVKAVESLKAFVVLRARRTNGGPVDRERRCEAARVFAAGLRDDAKGFIFHPYPITPYHADYLHHLDRIEAAKAALAAAARARGREAFAAAGWSFDLEEVPVTRLVTEAALPLDGWQGPPWLKEGWFQAYRLLAPALRAGAERETADGLYAQLAEGMYVNLAERTNLERRLLGVLTANCRRFVVGYKVRREYINADFTAGVENVGYDSQRGLSAPIFVRTVKLKDFPWNGWLRVGVAEPPTAAWNPVAGFTDPSGRLVWAILGDPAMVAFPSNASWIPNRFDFEVHSVRGQSGGFAVPRGAVLPTPGTGRLRPPAEPAFASATVSYKVLASPFHDDSETDVADLLYPFVFAYRWGVKAGPDDAAFDPRIANATAALRDRLMGVRVMRVDETVKSITQGIDVVQRTPVIETYLRAAPGDDQQVAALAPPWSTVPWELLALMEQAVLDGDAAFSEEEARRRGVPWLDLVRDSSLHAKLRARIDALAREGFRPESLKKLVSAKAATRRWRALAAFADAHGHFLVTNGPYLLKKWGAKAAVFGAFRDMRYPLGFGTFDRFVHPPRAVIGAVRREGDRIVVSADMEKVIRRNRQYETVREPLTHHSSRGLYGVLVVTRYLLIAPDGTVIAADRMRWGKDNRFVVELPKTLKAGRYTVLVGLYLDGNALAPSTGMLQFVVGASGPGKE